MIIRPLAVSGQTVSSQNSSENRIALKLENLSLNSTNREQLRGAQQMGVQLLEVSFPISLNDSLLNDFYLLVDTEQNFQTIHGLSDDLESIISSIQMNYNAVPEQLRDNIAAVKLFDFPADYDSRFPDVIRNLMPQLQGSINELFYYQSAFSQPDFNPDDFDFVSGRIETEADSSTISPQPVLLFEPSDDAAESLKKFEDILNQTQLYSESLIIIPADWFFERVNAQQSFSQIISSYINGKEVSFPMPAEDSGHPQVNWPVVFLLIIWGSFIIHYKFQPIYKAALPRYFLSHSFFVHDVKRYRIRNISSGLIVLFQHAILTGFFFYLLGDALISSTGLQSLSVHYPVLFYTGFEEGSLFAIGFVIAMISHTLSLVWLYLLNNQLKQLYQVVNLYSWPLHINLIVVTLVVYFVQLSDVFNWLIVAVGVYFFVWFFSFTIAAIDGAKLLNKHRVLNLFLTVGIHFLLISTTVLLIFLLPSIFEPLEMALLLP